MSASPGSRILIIVENLPVPFDRRVWNEARTLRRAGYKVCIICPKGKGYELSEEVIDGITVYRHPVVAEGAGALGYALEYGSALVWETLLAWKAFVRHGVDVLQACNPPDTIFLIGLMFKLIGKKFVFDHHDINPELYLAKFGRKGVFYRLLLLLERLTYRTADIAIAPNQSYKDIAVQRGGMDPARVFIVRSGPDLSDFREVQPREEYKFGHPHLVGYVGVMGKQEGIDLLLEAAAHIFHQRRRSDVGFVVIGDGTESASLRKYCTALGLDAHVRFTGRIPDDALACYLSTSDLCVNPDVANDMNDKSTMNKIMEYMAFRKPIVQFDLLEGRVSAREASLYARRNDPVDLGEKILELIDDADRRRRMGEYGHERLERELEWKYSAAVYLQAYATISGPAGAIP
jgi:glycosyltransferase involved in cell wall biosynthesis